MSADRGIQSPSLNDRSRDTYRLTADIDVGGAAATGTIDIPGLVLNSLAAETFTLAGFEAASGFPWLPAPRCILLSLSVSAIRGNSVTRKDATFAPSVLESSTQIHPPAATRSVVLCFCCKSLWYGYGKTIAGVPVAVNSAIVDAPPRQIPKSPAA